MSEPHKISLGDCPFCEEAVCHGEPHHPINHLGTETLAHRECLLREVIGSVGHQKGECSCFGGEGTGDDLSLSRRENARRAAAYFDLNGLPNSNRERN